MFPCSHTFSECFRTVILRILFPCSQKLANVPLFPSIFCQCSLVPQNPWEILSMGRFTHVGERPRGRDPTRAWYSSKSPRMFMCCGSEARLHSRQNSPPPPPLCGCSGSAPVQIRYAKWFRDKTLKAIFPLHLGIVFFFMVLIHKITCMNTKMFEK